VYAYLSRAGPRCRDGPTDQEGEMSTYVVLIDWTQQGVENFKDTVDRYEAARSS
jgi:uncharacterized protein with GYD domain